ncbi:TetR/AcrR family transcriptional regulator [Mesorhizobium sp. WSM4906]|uniref:TetR/AcrR family transcriptional regulator n=1 Tax=Mesorhizobium sp. WSM4906 TaxID=3038546 RepID=UPI0024180D04|nr:TetR/AcrR family transcriptional regulator [Mesorhizobium sp. WSM4906]WFP74376.1 TetR/AcrR family transcriptional regulator [Mesorhizobium sp. WSM4906]
MADRTADITDIGRGSSARNRVLDTATRLFYAEGVHAVGVDRIIAEAGVAKATFYKYFPAKDELVRAYVQNQSRLGRAATDRIGKRPARDMILAIFDLVADAAAQPGYRGCPFLNAAAEYPDPGHPVRQAIAEHRRWKHDLLCGLLADDGKPDPETTADILTVAGDGLLVASHLDKPANLRHLIRETVLQILGPSADK